MTALMLNEVERLLLKAEVERRNVVTVPVDTLRGLIYEDDNRDEIKSVIAERDEARREASELKTIMRRFSCAMKDVASA